MSTIDGSLKPVYKHYDASQMQCKPDRVVMMMPLIPFIPIPVPPLKMSHQVTQIQHPSTQHALNIPTFCEGSIFHIDPEGNLSVVKAVLNKREYIEKKETGKYEFVQLPPREINLLQPKIPGYLPVQYELGSFSYQRKKTY